MKNNGIISAVVLKGLFKKYSIIKVVLYLFIISYPLVLLTKNIIGVDTFKLIAFFVDNIGIIISLTVAAVFASFLIAYVNKGIGGSKSYKDQLLDFSRLSLELQAIKLDIMQLYKNGTNESQKVDLEPGEKAELIESAKKRIVGNTLLAADISLKNDISTFKHQIEINKHYSDIVYRLENEIDRLNRRGGVNLVIGVVIALVGILYLGYTVTNQIAVTDKLDYVIHMAPKLSFVIVIELFAYFFLKLYKNGFDEVKYFQNELTNIDSKVLGIKFLKDIRNEDMIGEVIKSLMATERNFILEKGQSTVSLEQQKIKSKEDKDIAEMIGELIKTKK